MVVLYWIYSYKEALVHIIKTLTGRVRVSRQTCGTALEDTLPDRLTCHCDEGTLRTANNFEKFTDQVQLLKHQKHNYKHYIKYTAIIKVQQATQHKTACTLPADSHVDCTEQSITTHPHSDPQGYQEAFLLLHCT